MRPAVGPSYGLFVGRSAEPLDNPAQPHWRRGIVLLQDPLAIVGMPLQIVRTVKGLGRVDSRPATFLPPDHYGCGLGCACFTGTLAAVEEHERGCLHFLEPLLPEGLDRDICNGDEDEHALTLRDIVEPHSSATRTNTFTIFDFEDFTRNQLLHEP